MDDLVVIIITLAIMVVGAIGQLKKKKVEETSPKAAGGAVSEGNFWDVLLQDGENNVAEPVEVELDENYHAPSKKVIKKDYSKSEIKKSTISDEIKKSEIGKIAVKESILDDFTIKKGVVFSEIMNRKYFEN